MYLQDKLLEKNGGKRDIFNSALGIGNGKIGGFLSDTDQQEPKAGIDTSNISINSDSPREKGYSENSQDL